VRVALAGAGQQLRRAVRPADLRRQAGDDAFEACRIGTRGFGRSLRLAQLGRRDHFLGLGDLLGRFDRADPAFQFFQVCHEGPYISSSRPKPEGRKPLSENLGEGVERGNQALLGVVAKVLGVADRL
jgi:hypothetical protein